MKKKLALAVITLILWVNIASASDQQTFIPIGGDDEAEFGFFFSDGQINFYQDYSGSSPSPEEGGGGGGGETTCTIQGYYCCQACVEGTNVSLYDGTCEDDTVCCSLCEEDVIEQEEKPEEGKKFGLLPESFKDKFGFTDQQWWYMFFGLLLILLILFVIYTNKKSRY